MIRLKKFMCFMLAVVTVLGAVSVGGAFNRQVSAADSFVTVPGSTLTVDSAKGIIKNVLAGTTAATIAGNFQGNVAVYNASGVKVADSDVVGTGFTLRLSTGDSLAIVVYGDTTGDGVITTADLLIVASAIKGTSTLSGANRFAADVNMDGANTAADSISDFAYSVCVFDFTYIAGIGEMIHYFFGIHIVSSLLSQNLLLLKIRHWPSCGLPRGDSWRAGAQ